MSSNSNNFRGRGRGRFQYRKRGFSAKTVNKNNQNSTPTVVKPHQQGPYKGWPIYFPQEGGLLVTFSLFTYFQLLFFYSNFRIC